MYLIGHSYGGDAAAETAKKLVERAKREKRAGIVVHLLIQIDSIGTGDEDVIERVGRRINFFQLNGGLLGLMGPWFVGGAENHLITDTSHTDIDDDVRVWGNTSRIAREVYEAKQIGRRAARVEVRRP